MNYRPWLEGDVLRQMGGLPHDAFDALARTMARICEDPYDRLFSLAVRDEDPRERMAELGDAGFIQFTVDESAGLVRVYDLPSGLIGLKPSGSTWPPAAGPALCRHTPQPASQRESCLRSRRRLTLKVSASRAASLHALP